MLFGNLSVIGVLCDIHGCILVYTFYLFYNDCILNLINSIVCNFSEHHEENRGYMRGKYIKRNVTLDGHMKNTLYAFVNYMYIILSISLKINAV